MTLEHLTLGPQDSSPGRLIREWRRRRGLTQAELANAIGIDRTYLTKIERGNRGYIPGMLEAVAEALGCAPSDLINRHPDHASEIETLYMSLTAEDRTRALAVLKAMFPR